MRSQILNRISVGSWRNRPNSWRGGVDVESRDIVVRLVSDEVGLLEVVDALAGVDVLFLFWAILAT